MVTWNFHLGDKYKANDVLSIAYALKQNSEHPIATGIVEKAKELKLAMAAISDFKAITGKGIQAMMEGMQVNTVSPGYLKENSLTVNIPGSTEAETIVYVLVDEKIAEFIALADEIRKESPEAIRNLHANGIRRCCSPESCDGRSMDECKCCGCGD